METSMISWEDVLNASWSVCVLCWGYAAILVGRAMMIVAQRKHECHATDPDDEDWDDDPNDDPDDEDGSADNGDPFAIDPQYDPSDWWKHSGCRDYARA